MMPILLTLFTSNNKSGPKTPGPQTNWDAGSGKHLEKNAKTLRCRHLDPVTTAGPPGETSTWAPCSQSPAAAPSPWPADRGSLTNWFTRKADLTTQLVFVFVDGCWATSPPPVSVPFYPLPPFFSLLSRSCRSLLLSLQALVLAALCRRVLLSLAIAAIFIGNSWIRPGTPLRWSFRLVLGMDCRAFPFCLKLYMLCRASSWGRTDRT